MALATLAASNLDRQGLAMTTRRLMVFSACRSPLIFALLSAEAVDVLSLEPQHCANVVWVSFCLLVRGDLSPAKITVQSVPVVLKLDPQMPANAC